MTENLSKPDYVFTSEQILSLGLTKIPMLVEGLFPKKGLAAIAGSSDGGKSFLSLCLATCICGDSPDLFGLKVNRQHGRVIIVCTEDTAEDICVRLTGLLKEKNIRKEDLTFIFDTKNLPSKLSQELIRRPADLVIVDTFGDLFRGNLNDSIAIRQFLEPYKALASKCSCLFLFNHHIGKGKENNSSPSKNDVLGSQGIESACRTVLMLKKRPDSKRILTVVKGNHMPEEIKNKGILLSFHPERGFETTGETINYSEGSLSNVQSHQLDQLVLEAYPRLKSYQKVADELRVQGHKIDKNKVGEIWKRVNPSSETIGKMTDGHS